MKNSLHKLLGPLLLLAAARPTQLHAQVVNATQSVTLQGLRTANAHGSFTAAQWAPDGTLILLLDEHDGIRLLKSDSTGTNLLAQTQTGAAGDSGLSLTLDPAGNIYVTGTTTSGTLTGITGAAFPSRADTSTNSFLAEYNANLQLVALTFLGAGRTSAASVAATSDAVFVTGTTYSPTFPVTPSAIGQSPATGSLANGFVERFNPDTLSLAFATYLTGANGDTTPTSIAADAADNAYITGSTTAPGYPTFAALQPRIPNTTSGFLTKLTPAGDGLIFSTFIAGTGLNSVAYDNATNSLLLAGNVALGQFPVATVSAPLTSATYATLLRIRTDGQSLTQSVLLPPSSQVFATPGPNNTVWVSGALTTPLFPGTTPPNYNSGDSFLLHLTATGLSDQTLRIGGTVINNPSYASLETTVATPALSPDAATVFLPGTLTATVSASVLSTQRFDLPLVASPNTLLPNTLRDTLPQSCTPNTQCTGSAALLTRVTTAASAPQFALSTDDLPNLTLRNLGSSTATGVSISATGFTPTSNCAATLPPSQQCAIALAGSGPGSITISAANAPTYVQTLPSNTSTPDALALNTSELEFGIQTSTSPATTRTVTITNLSATTQTFTSALDGGPTSTPYTFTQTATDCTPANSPATFTLAPNATCHITLGLTVSTSPTNDGPIRAAWKIGPRDITLTAFAQAASLSLSAPEIDFGLQFSGATTLHLPRYLYLSNNSATPRVHAPVSLPPTSPFTVLDECPSTLEPHTLCRLTLTYASSIAPSTDSATLALDDGLFVLVTGETLPPATATTSAANPTLTASPTSLTFSSPVVVTGISAATQSITLKNTGATAFPISTTFTGDFALINTCPTTLTPGASCQLLISFTPAQPGPRQGLLSIATTSGFAPAYISLSGTALPILPANNGLLNLGQTLAGEPTVAWYKIQQSLPAPTAITGGVGFGVALVEDTGSGHGSLPPSSFTSSATGTCSNCWLGIQFLSQTAGPASTSVSLSTVANGQPYVLTLTADALPVQGLLLTPITQDFGPVAINSSSAPTTFTLANLLASPSAVTIQSVTATGDFTLVTNTTGGSSCTGSLPATASCFVQVAFSPTATGIRNGTLTITTSAGTASTPLTGYGSPDPGLAIKPNALIFTNAPGTASTQQTITLSNTGTASLTVGTPTAQDPSFAAASTCSTLAPGSICTLQITYTPGNPLTSSTLSIPVTATLNGQTSTTTYTIPLTGNYTAQDGGLQILPGELNFGSTATGALGYTRLFTLNNLTAKPLNINLSLPRQFALAAPNPCPTLAANGTCQFSISFLPSTAGALTGSVFAQGSPTDGSAPVETIAYMLGYGAGAAQLAISGYPIPNSPLPFGQLASGQSSQQTLTLRNTGATPLNIHRLSSEPPFLSTTNCTAALAPGATCTVTLTYSPIYEVATGSSITSPRTDAGTLIIESDDASSPDIVDLSGTSTPIASSNPASSAILSTFDLSQSALTFANTTVGNASPSQTVTLTNTGTTNLQIASVLAPPDFTATSTCTTLPPGATCPITVQFTPGNASTAPASTANARSGTLEILSNAATSLEFITLLGSSAPAPLTLNPVALDFGTVNTGATGSLSVSVTNTSAVPINFTAVTATGDYTVQRGTCPANGSSLAASTTCTLNVVFTPTSTGTRTGTLSLSSNATQLPLTVSLTGTGTQAHLQVTPGALAFGPVSLGATASLTVNLTNTGTATVTNIAATISGTDAADFAVVSPCSTATLAPNQGCTMSVSFTPSASGSRAATLNVASSDPNSPATIPLTGAGAQAGSFTLTVNGATTASATVKSGSPATYALTLTSSNGFTGSVALTCTPVSAAQYASCSLLSPTLTISSSAQNSTATINTITSTAGLRNSALESLLLMPLALMRRRTRRTVSTILRTICIAVLAALAVSTATGCGGNTPAGGGDSNLLYTPPGTYQYNVTATSTSGTQITSTVTLTLIVQ
jgi:trimeric autotransporter adhesin